MNKITDLKYCLQTTKTHSLAIAHPRCLLTVKEIICNEGGRAKGFNDEQVVNLDEVEIALARKEARRTDNSTMDIFFGVSKNNSNKNIALVEFKLRVKNPKEISKSELENKVKGSVRILGNELPMLKNYYFVFNTKAISQAKSNFNRLFSGRINSSYIAVTEQELKQIFW